MRDIGHLLTSESTSTRPPVDTGFCSMFPDNLMVRRAEKPALAPKESKFRGFKGVTKMGVPPRVFDAEQPTGVKSLMFLRLSAVICQQEGFRRPPAVLCVCFV